MARGRKSDLTVAIDIGTETVRCVIAERTEAGLDIIGVGKAKSTGLKRGVVINIEATVSAIRSAVEAAELMAGREVVECLTSVTGSHIASRNLPGVVAVRNSEVRPDDVERVLKFARAVRLEEGRICIHVLPVEFMVDDIPVQQSPLGIAGVRLEAKVHMVTGAKPPLENITTCCSREGIGVLGMVFSPLAASQALLHEDEKELGVMLADIGAGTTDFALWYNGGVIQTGVVPIGGRQISDEIATALRCPRGDAELMKVKYGHATAAGVGEDETIDVPAVGGRPAQKRKRAVLAGVVEQCLEEVFTTMGEQVQRAGNAERVSSGLVLAGGCAQITGVVELAEQILGIPVRVGTMLPPDSTVGGVTSAVTDPGYAVALGMVLMAARDTGIERTKENVEDAGLWRRLREWLEKAFVLNG